jgi:hypothetical protein
MAAPVANAKDAAAASVSMAKEAAFPLPPPPALKALAPDPVASAAPPPPPAERVLVPPRGTLAAGRWEAKPATIWIVVAVGIVLLLGWTLLRARRAAVARRKKEAALLTVRKAG